MEGNSGTGSHRLPKFEKSVLHRLRAHPAQAGGEHTLRRPRRQKVTISITTDGRAATDLCLLSRLSSKKQIAKGNENRANSETSKIRARVNTLTGNLTPQAFLNALTGLVSQDLATAARS